MSWDESLFRVGLNSLKWLGRKTRETEEDRHRVVLSSMERRLKMLACALSGEAIELKAAEACGGYSGATLFLPSAMDLFPRTDLNIESYVFRLVYSLASREMGFHLPERSCSPLEQLVMTLVARPATEAWLERELPRSLDLFARISPVLGGDADFLELSAPIWAEALSAAKDATSSSEIWAISEKILAALDQRQHETRRFNERLKALPSLKIFGLLMPRSEGRAKSDESGQPEFSLESLASGTEKKAMKAVEQATEVKLGEKKIDENPLVHSFEKVHTAEEYQGGKKALDGADELEDHGEALDELNLKHVIRSRERTDSVYRADFALESGAPDLAEEEGDSPGVCHIYDEWDEAKKRYRSEWCRVYSRTAPVRPLTSGESTPQEIAARHLKQTRELKLQMIRMVNERRWRTRQVDGPEIDLDAVVDSRAMVKSGQTPSGRLYLSRRRDHRDIATLILMDLSLSTDSWIENKRVLDISRDSVLILTDVLEGLHDKTAIGGFFSNTRRDCRFHTFKDFDEPWSKARQRLASAAPTGYTRIGPALRHATKLLKEVPAKKRLLLLISDGKPTDYDRYEGRYGINDVKQAIRESAQAGVKTRALAIDAQAKFYLPQMFGHGNYHILAHPTQLAASLTRIYAEVLK